MGDSDPSSLPGPSASPTFASETNLAAPDSRGPSISPPVGLGVSREPSNSPDIVLAPLLPVPVNPPVTAPMAAPAAERPMPVRLPATLPSPAESVQAYGLPTATGVDWSQFDFHSLPPDDAQLLYAVIMYQPNVINSIDPSLFSIIAESMRKKPAVQIHGVNAGASTSNSTLGAMLPGPSNASLASMLGPSNSALASMLSKPSQPPKHPLLSRRSLPAQPHAPLIPSPLVTHSNKRPARPVSPLIDVVSSPKSDVGETRKTALSKMDDNNKPSKTWPVLREFVMPSRTGKGEVWRWISPKYAGRALELTITQATNKMFRLRCAFCRAEKDDFYRGLREGNPGSVKTIRADETDFWDSPDEIEHVCGYPNNTKSDIVEVFSAIVVGDISEDLIKNEEALKKREVDVTKYVHQSRWNFLNDEQKKRLMETAKAKISFENCMRIARKRAKEAGSADEADETEVKKSKVVAKRLSFSANGVPSRDRRSLPTKRMPKEKVGDEEEIKMNDDDDDDLSSISGWSGEESEDEDDGEEWTEETTIPAFGRRRSSNNGSGKPMQIPTKVPRRELLASVQKKSEENGENEKEEVKTPVTTAKRRGRPPKNAGDRTPASRKKGGTDVKTPASNKKLVKSAKKTEAKKGKKKWEAEEDEESEEEQEEVEEERQPRLSLSGRPQRNRTANKLLSDFVLGK